MNCQNSQVKQCVLHKNIKKNFRGPYKKINNQVKREILERLRQQQATLSQISKEFQVNKETIRSLYKKQDHKNLFLNLELYLVSKCLLQQELTAQYFEKVEISKFVKQEIDNYKNDQQLQIIIQNIYDKRLHSKSRLKKSVIEFNSKNRRIINKIVSFVILAGQLAAINNTDAYEIPEKKIQDEYYNSFMKLFLEYYPVYLNNFEMSQQTQEQDSSFNWTNQQSETRPLRGIYI